ncbi:hypothetical protein ZOSMA_68G00070 [Zostera marina]|uniref:Uncharacterized protein n=1 Tax=Zostera marina TaxID=29655 RepID=A0A0K9NRL8_ZOSMR|nr:hypothetical protein ZOSMA_68G00070 [Zostera marina]
MDEHNRESQWVLDRFRPREPRWVPDRYKEWRPQSSVLGMNRMGNTHQFT